MPKTKLAREAVVTLLAHMSRARDREARPGSGSQAIAMAIMEASAPTTMPCTWIRARLAAPISQVCSIVSRCPKFAWVERREASVISRLPFSPINAGTMMNSSGTAVNTFPHVT